MSSMIHTVCNNQWKQNGYIIENEEKEALIIDPGSQFELYREIIEDKQLTPMAIMNTHAHFDHIGAIDQCCNHFSIAFYLHSGDHRLLKQANMYRMVFGVTGGVPIPCVSNDLALENEELCVGHFTIQWVATPGHTPGGVCLRIEDALFTGDTLMSTGAGRTDLPGGDPELIMQSIDRLAALDRSLTIWPGHGQPLNLSDALNTARETQAILI